MVGYPLWDRICSRTASDCGRFFSTHWEPFAIFFSATIFTTIFFPLRSRSISGREAIICNADGNVISSVGTEPLWDIEEYFAINMLIPNFTFTQAKVVDACWDIVIGRGGQAICTLRRSISLTMEGSALSVSAVTAICCQQIQLLSTWQLSRDLILQFRRYGHLSTVGRHIKLVRSGAYIFVCVYVLSFATMASVMTGYRADLTGFFDANNSQAGMTEPLGSIYKAQITLVDGDRVNLPKDLLFPAYGERVYDSELSITLQVCEWVLCFLRPVMAITLLTTKLTDNDTLSQYCTKWIGNYTCPELLDNDIPRCSCTSLKRNSGLDQITSTITIHGERFELPEPALSITETWSSWAWNGKRLDENQLANTSRCVAAGQYSWGFSASLLLTFCAWTIIYAILLLSLELEVYLFSQSQRYSRPYSTYQDVLNIASALTTRFGDNILDLPPEKLDKMIDRHKGSIRLGIGECPLSRVGAIRHRAMVDQAAWEAKENETHELAVMTRDADHSDRESDIHLQATLETASHCSSPRASLSGGGGDPATYNYI